jgi:putative membrane protein
MHFLSFAKGALAMFWLVALLNFFYPFGEPLQRPLLLAAGVILLAHVGEAALFNRKLKARPYPWLERLQVLLFGFLHLRGMR